MADFVASCESYDSREIQNAGGNAALQWLENAGRTVPWGPPWTVRLWHGKPRASSRWWAGEEGAGVYGSSIAAW